MPISIGGLSPLTPKLPSSDGASGTPAGADFGSALKQAVSALGELGGKADASSLALAKGEPIDIHEVMLNTEQASLGFGVVGAALIGLLFIVSTVGRGADTAVAFSGLSTDDMAAIVTKLKDAKIPYELADGGVIRVASGQVQDARLATAGMGLNGKPATGSGFELFNQPSFAQTEFSQKVNYQRALENEIARSIDQMDA